MLDTRKYDVYGGVRAGGAGTRHRFVGQLGHTSDDETGLLYMRARCYDPVVGRFVSEDPGRAGGTWYIYADANPIGRVDRDGRLAVGICDVLAGVWAGMCTWQSLSATVFTFLGVFGGLCLHDYNKGDPIDWSVNMADAAWAAGTALLGFGLRGSVGRALEIAGERGVSKITMAFYDLNLYNDYLEALIAVL